MSDSIKGAWFRIVIIWPLWRGCVKERCLIVASTRCLCMKCIRHNTHVSTFTVGQLFHVGSTTSIRTCGRQSVTQNTHIFSLGNLLNSTMPKMENNSKHILSKIFSMTLALIEVSRASRWMKTFQVDYCIGYWNVRSCDYSLIRYRFKGLLAFKIVSDEALSRSLHRAIYKTTHSAIMRVRN